MEGLWWIVALWVIAALFGGRRRRPASPPAETGESGSGLSNEFLRALEELKRAEQEAERRLTGTAPQQREAPTSVAAASTEREAKYYLEQRKQAARRKVQPGQRLEVFVPRGEPARGRPPRRSARPLETAADTRSSEIEPVVVPLESRDYDEEAQRIVAERRRAAEREGVSIEGLSEAQLARRGERPAVAIGGAAEHAEWHERLEATGRAPARAGRAERNPLARFADGSLRSAVVLSEILGPPLGERR
jgi:hypothetical protein